MYRYSRIDLLRILRVAPRQLQTWEKAGLVKTGEDYSFFDLLQIKKVRDLCSQRVRPTVIRRSLDAMLKQVSGMENPLLEAGAYLSGHRVAFRHEGRLLEPIAGQFMFDFASEETKIVTSPRRTGPELVVTDVVDLFARGIQLEENPSTQSEAIAVYLKVLEMDAQHAAAHINLGTLYYNRQEYAWPRSTTGRRSRLTRGTRSPISTWATCWMRRGGLTKRSRLTRRRSNWLRHTPTHITTSHSRMKRFGSHAKRCNTGARM